MWHFKPNRDPRVATVKILDLVDQGVLSADTMLEACLWYMSESDVAELARREGFIDSEEA